MSYRPDKLVIDTHTLTHRPTDAADDNTRRLKLASGKNVICLAWMYFIDMLQVSDTWQFLLNDLLRLNKIYCQT